MVDIKLNFLPINEDNFSFTVFRKIQPEGKNDDNTVFSYSLPLVPESEEWAQYLVSFQQREGFEPYDVGFLVNRSLTKKCLLQSLFNKLEKDGRLALEYVRAFGGDRLEFTITEHDSGRRIIVLMPYFLEVQGKYGFLIDFRFAMNEDTSFNKEVQKLSLSLDAAGNSNKNYYTDKYRQIQIFLSAAHPIIGQFSLFNGPSITLNQALCSVSGFQLNKKEYIFHNRATSFSQFQGIRNFGPFSMVDENVTFVFLFEDRFKSFANDLYLSLVGKLNPGTFPGLATMFKLNLGINNVKRITLQGYSKAALLGAIEQVKAIKKLGEKVIGIYIEDYSSDDENNIASSIYYFLKYHFIKEDIPLQVVNYRKLGAKNALKWSTSNLALQIFSKIGGIPWIVRPSNNHCLILGIGSSHRREPKTGRILKYFAYTVCLDSSGLYKSLDVLADADEEDTYLQALEKNLVTLLKSDKFTDYRTCVLHLPFKIKEREIDALTKAVEQVRQMTFVTLKVNLDNKFFGYSSHNTLVPYESSCIRLSKSEYLVWFDGLQYGKELVDKRLSGPVHIQFLNQPEHNFNLRDYLQDVLNLSGANWRGFNSRSVPISIFYSKLIADYTKAFEALPEYEEGAVSNEKPWFL